ncbi:MAG: cupin domain-containing protein [Candidatus Solibacter sp.]
MSRQKDTVALTPDEQQEIAALAALDLASPTEAASVPRRMVKELRESAWQLAESVDAVAPPPALKERLMTRVAQFEQLKPLADVRRNEDFWAHSGMPGIDIKQLFKESETGRTTYLLRMEPGCRLPAHVHHDAEQCLVLKGDIAWGDIVYEEGDFIVMGKGTHHPEIHTVNGNLLLLISGHTEFDHA